MGCVNRFLRLGGCWLGMCFAVVTCLVILRGVRRLVGWMMVFVVRSLWVVGVIRLILKYCWLKGCVELRLEFVFDVDLDVVFDVDVDFDVYVDELLLCCCLNFVGFVCCFGCCFGGRSCDD